MIIKDEVLGKWQINAVWKKFNVHCEDIPKIEYQGNTLNEAVAYIFEKRLAEIDKTVTLQEYNQIIKDMDADFQAAFKLKEEPIIEKYQPMIAPPEQERVS